MTNKASIDVLPARIPTESDFSPISSLASSHRRMTSAEGHEEASLFLYPPIGLVDQSNIDQSEGTRKMAFYPRPEVRGFTARVVSITAERGLRLGKPGRCAPTESAAIV